MVLISCGGSPAPKPAEVGKPAPPPPVEPAPKPAPMLTGHMEGETPPPAPPPEPTPPPKKPVYETIRDTDGDIAGLAGFSIKRNVDPNHCGGVSIVTKRAKKVPKEDQPLADVFALEFPTGLSFDDKNKTASMQKFNAFLQKLTKVGAASREYYEKQLQAGDAVAKMAAAARMAQIFTRLASVLARAEIPLDVRSGDFAQDKIDAFCDSLVQYAEPIQSMAEQAMAACASKKATINGGWWDPVCTVP